MSALVQSFHEDAAVNVTACPAGHVHLVARGPMASIDMPMSPDQARELAALLLVAAGAAQCGKGDAEGLTTH